jgi:hypothetical protein
LFSVEHCRPIIFDDAHNCNDVIDDDEVEDDDDDDDDEEEEDGIIICVK